MSYPACKATAQLARFAGHVPVETARELVNRKVWSGQMLGEDGMPE